MIDPLTLSMVFKIALAGALGMVIGAEREHRHKSAGLRTCTVVAIGAVLFTILSVYGFPGMAGNSSYDPSRIASQIVVGIGFIGAGMIILRENKVEGLTTAASVWTTAAVAMAVGFGFYFVAIFTALLVLGVLEALGFLIKRRSLRNKNEQEQS